MNETTVTIQGNLVADPERRTSRNGEFTTLRVAVNEFHRDQGTGEYVDGQSSFYSVRAFRALGDNVHRSLRQGAPVIVVGNQRIRRWQTAAGETRETVEIDARHVGPDLRFGVAVHQRVPAVRADSAPSDPPRSDSGGRESGGETSPAPTAADPWARRDSDRSAWAEPVNDAAPHASAAQQQTEAAEPAEAGATDRTAGLGAATDAPTDAVAQQPRAS